MSLFDVCRSQSDLEANLFKVNEYLYWVFLLVLIEWVEICFKSIGI
jgi:hypothetical protein